MSSSDLTCLKEFYKSSYFNSTKQTSMRLVVEIFQIPSFIFYFSRHAMSAGKKGIKLLIAQIKLVPVIYALNVDRLSTSSEIVKFLYQKVLFAVLLLQIQSFCYILDPGFTRWGP